MININKNWYFQKLPEESLDIMNDIRDIHVEENQYELINLPHTWYEDGNMYEGTVIYKKILRLANLSGKRAFLPEGIPNLPYL